MKKKFKQAVAFIKDIDYRHYICGAITIIFLLLAIFYFKYGYLRIWESLKDLWTSSLFYINELFELDIHAEITINNFTKLPFEMPFNLPNTWEEFKVLCSDYWNLLKSKENLQAYFVFLGDVMYYISKIILLLMPIVIILMLAMNGQSEVNNDYNEDSKPLVWWKENIEKKLYVPIKNWVLEFISFIKENSFYGKIWLFIWVYNFNIIAIAIEFIAYYLYFVASFEWTTLYIQVLKLLMDLSVMIDFIPLFGWFLITLWVINMIRHSIGYKRLNHMELKDRGFINERPIVIMFNGTMGSNKTTAITDIAISQEIMLRDKAFEKLLENDLKFPFFPWINLENSLKGAIKHHYVYNLATCKRWVKNKMMKFEKLPCRRNIFMYDYERYGMTYDDKLALTDIWHVIENYVQLYFVYIIQSSLLISNYSIRVDNVLEDLGNFPLWNVELFKKDSRMIEAYSRHAHILDFDMLRLGKKVLEYNEKADCFEFGVINITEIGKERGNTIELREIKKSDLTANQKNDLFNTWLKMIRHSATIDNFPFVKVITDDQRPESWGADARDLCELVYIEKAKEMKLAMPLFSLEDLLLNWVINKFSEKYYDYRFSRADNTLRMYLFHGLIGKLNKYLKGIYNTFGYKKLDITIESGRQDGKAKDGKYFLMFKKIYSRRFSTDCFSDFFNEKALRSQLGLDGLDEFKNVKASFEEMLMENSYFFADLMKIAEDNVLDK